MLAVEESTWQLHVDEVSFVLVPTQSVRIDPQTAQHDPNSVVPSGLLLINVFVHPRLLPHRLVITSPARIEGPLGSRTIVLVICIPSHTLWRRAGAGIQVLDVVPKCPRDFPPDDGPLLHQLLEDLVVAAIA
ncbi:hypothetical protein GSI_00513 [Ganoderma sinense ZZ0214-1]|uniref:Uncharacterized protein n=1 Tax=Ganoderma sinense ZZ0214-1 TaxID=1077348 RepID=A0A2G8SSY9_9APHY|nr:hypothetical protein GSI_00513 [Ganoderma sinense ZZ0214-1]